MIKKEFEKESYLAPEWGLRVVTVKRYILQGTPTGDPDIDEDDVVDDNGSWGN